MRSTRQRRFGAALSAVAVGSLLAGCGGGGGLSSQVRQSFLNALYSQAPAITSTRTDTQLVSMGQAVCSDLASGAGVQQVADRVQLAEPLPSGDIGAVMSAAVSTICPQYRKLLGQ